MSDHLTLKRFGYRALPCQKRQPPRKLPMIATEGLCALMGEWELLVPKI
ncbi:MAG: hypothetical protein KME50_35405 [Nostoc desertorum CM1-VF14]|nr:hypothetical protein [Nostoc desertorum CM1-VF14]